MLNTRAKSNIELIKEEYEKMPIRKLEKSDEEKCIAGPTYTEKCYN